MLRARIPGVVLVSLISLGASTSRPARACTPVKVLTRDEVVSPASGTLLGTESSLLFRGRDVSAFVEAGTQVRLPLALQALFAPLRPSTLPFAFYRPSSPFTDGEDYVLRSDEGAVAVPFRATARPAHTEAVFSISVFEQTVPEQALTSASCYSGPLEDRPYTRVGNVIVTSTPPTRFVVSVVTLDSVSGQFIEDATFNQEGDAGSVRLELPLPPGVADCLTVQVLDLAGAVLASEGSFCVVLGRETRSMTAEVFEPEHADMAPGSAGEGGAEVGESAPGPGRESRTSRGCELSPRPGGPGSAAVIFALAWLVGARRRFLS
jgi:hypothetical protein